MSVIKPFLVWPDEYPLSAIEVDLQCQPSQVELLRTGQPGQWQKMRGHKSLVVLDPFGHLTRDMRDVMLSREHHYVTGVRSCREYLTSAQSRVCLFYYQLVWEDQDGLEVRSETHTLGSVVLKVAKTAVESGRKNVRIEVTCHRL